MNSKTDQQKTLLKLLKSARNVALGKHYGFSDIKSYRNFADQVPIHFYQDMLPYINRIKEGEADVLWPGTTSCFVVSAGTSGEGKHLPLTDDRLKSDRYFMKKAAGSYLRQRPNVFPLFGKHVSLPGSVDRIGPLEIGEISGFSAQRVPFWLRPFQLISPTELTALSFSEKFNLILEKAIGADLKVISAVPSWVLTLFQQAIKRTGRPTIADIWPGLKLLICGGVKLSNYRAHLEKLAGPLSLDFIETYGASEGYFAFSDHLAKKDLKLVTGNGIFYEFIPDPLPDEQALAIQDVLPLWKIETGTPYAMVVTTNSGLWRYALKDIVEFTSTEPSRLVVKGRISEMLDDFGEAVYIYEAEKALHKAAVETEQNVGAFTIMPVLHSESDVPRHHWYIQFFDPIHTQTLERLATLIDRNLEKSNRHYAIRRESGAMAAPHVKSITQDEINRWLETHGKDKAQGKFPKIIREPLF